ncbi:MAG: LuxR C-terminal-related transcriptional regulator [Pseudomonadota bacterium]
MLRSITQTVNMPMLPGVDVKYPVGTLDILMDRARALSGMDNAGIYVIGEDGRFCDGAIAGLPETFKTAYETKGLRIDPVVASVRERGTPMSTLTLLGPRWHRSQLYRQISRYFRIEGFATIPIFDDQHMRALLFFGAERPENVGRIGHEGMLELSATAMRIAAEFLSLPVEGPVLTGRQIEVAGLAARGLSNRQIAAELGTGEAAVRKHLKALNRIFRTSNRTAMSAAFMRWH